MTCPEQGQVVLLVTTEQRCFFAVCCDAKFKILGVVRIVSVFNIVPTIIVVIDFFAEIDIIS